MMITNKFNAEHAKTGRHQGVDFVTDDRIVIYPYYRGRVMYVGYEPAGAGRFIVIRYIGRDNRTHYIEADHFAEIFIKAGQLIFKGAKVGRMGNTGNVVSMLGGDGTHCHWARFEPVDCEKDLTEGEAGV